MPCIALGACRDNLWVHVALGQLALRDSKIPLAPGHFGYAVELGTEASHRASRGGCPASEWRTGRFSRRSKAWPGFSVVVGKPKDADDLSRLATRLAGTFATFRLMPPVRKPKACRPTPRRA